MRKSITILLLALLAALCPERARADAPEGSADEPNTEAASTETASVGAPEFATVVAGVPIRLTGILHAMIVGTTGVQSYGLPTPVAPTSAINPALFALPDSAELSFQVQQTRLGMILGEGTDVRGQVEIDFVHFDQSSPTTQAFPRLRIASLEWQFAPEQRLFLGQTWDIFGNATGSLLSHSMNLVGTLFQAGNIGFMRHQLGWRGRFGDIELAIAVGLIGANTGPSFSQIEQSLTPTGSARWMLYVNPRSVIGLAGIATSLRFTNGAMEDRRLAIGGVAFADLSFDTLVIHAEAYIAQNLANTGALNLSQGRFGVDVADAGGYVSARWTLGQHAITAMAGIAAVLNPKDVVPGYTRTNPDDAIATPTLAAGPGIRLNTTAHIGYWFSPLPGLSIVLEPYIYFTRFALEPADAAHLDRNRIAYGAQLGSLFQF